MNSGAQANWACSAPQTCATGKTLMQELRYWMSSKRVAEMTGRNNIEVASEIRNAVDAKVRTSFADS